MALLVMYLLPGIPVYQERMVEKKGYLMIRQCCAAAPGQIAQDQRADFCRNFFSMLAPALPWKSFIGGCNLKMETLTSLTNEKRDFISLTMARQTFSSNGVGTFMQS